MDTAQVVFIDDHLWKLCELQDISRQIEDNVKLSWDIILVPNLVCIAGAFFLGFGVMASVLANNVAAIAALANGLRPRGVPTQQLTPYWRTGGAWIRFVRLPEWIISPESARIVNRHRYLRK
jgi:hypothetical protein